MTSTIKPASKLVQLLSDRSQTPNLTIVDTILFHLGIADVYALHAAGRSLRWLVDYMTDSPGLLNVNKQLATFFNDPVRFRRELGKCDGLMAGDFVRNFLEFGRWKVPSLLIYVERGSKWQGFVNYLVEYESYKAESERHIFFKKETISDLVIVIKATSGPPVVEIINTATTTAGLNIMSWKKAYSLLPIPTVVAHKFYPLKPFDETLGRTLRQRANWGWTTRDMLWPDLTTQLISRKECRQVGGPTSLVIKLGGTPSGDFTPDYILEGCIFSVVWESEVTNRRLTVSIEPMKKSIAMRYAYTNGASGAACKDWERFLRVRLDRWIYVEMVKMDHDERPRGFHPVPAGNYHVSIPSGYQPPSTWDYADDQLIPWFQEWERTWGN